eukprot:SAG31_NODE_8317_length_1475_cov_1.488372_1_plen_163_part_10
MSSAAEPEDGSQWSTSDEKGSVQKDKLRKKFHTLDVTGSGSIAAGAMGVWLACEHSNIAYKALEKALADRTDIAADKISFENFYQLCEALDVQSASEALEKDYSDLAHQAMSPLWMIMEEENRAAKVAGEKRIHTPARVKAAKAIDSNTMHIILLILIVIDAF